MNSILKLRNEGDMLFERSDIKLIFERLKIKFDYNNDLINYIRYSLQGSYPNDENINEILKHNNETGLKHYSLFNIIKE